MNESVNERTDGWVNIKYIIEQDGRVSMYK